VHINPCTPQVVGGGTFLVECENADVEPVIRQRRKEQSPLALGAS
jgi:hypothetical protein